MAGKKPHRRRAVLASRATEFPKPRSRAGVVRESRHDRALQVRRRVELQFEIDQIRTLLKAV
jgi:hypothetical protein